MQKMHRLLPYFFLDVILHQDLGARFDCVVYHILTVEDLSLNFIKLVVILNNFICVYKQSHIVIRWVQFRGNIPIHS